MVTESAVAFAEIVAQFDTQTLARHPGVRATATAVRSTNISATQWLLEALVARDNLKPTTALSSWIGVYASLADVLSNLGRHDEARAAFASLERIHENLPNNIWQLANFSCPRCCA